MAHPTPSADNKLPPVTTARVDIGTVLAELCVGTGVVQAQGGGFRIKVFHARAFPWDEIFKQLLYRDFRVYVTHHKADLFIEASP